MLLFSGESQVYTVGAIGRFRVVSTKLARYPASTQARIAAENTVTRMLGGYQSSDPKMGCFWAELSITYINASLVVTYYIGSYVKK